MLELPRITRRNLLAASGAALATALLPRRSWSALSTEAQRALESSPLVYISPLRADGSESRCHAELWFVTEGEDVLVATPTDSWRARSAAQDGSRARLWVGDHGVWTTSDGAFRSAPSYDAHARLDADPKAQAYALAAFGRKYEAEWGRWGPRFRKGFNDGTRSLLRYTPVV